MVKRQLGFVGAVLLFLVPVLSFAAEIESRAAGHPALTRTRNSNITPQLAKLHIPFVANQGQTDTRVKYYAQTFFGTVFVTKNGEIYYSLPGMKNKGTASYLGLRERFVGRKTAQVKGQGKPAPKISYFVGKDPSAWRSGIPTYDLVSLGELYRGINVKVRACGSNVEKLFYVSPGTNPEKIRIELSGVKTIRVNDAGELELETELGVLRFTKPVAYQQIDGKKKSVKASYQVKGDEYCFKIGKYDEQRELVIDPLVASTFLGGAATEDLYGDNLDFTMVTGPGGNVFVAGVTTSFNFPATLGAYQPVLYGAGDVFVAKLSSDLSTLDAATFLGGTGGAVEAPGSLFVDPSGNVYVAGYTDSVDFPTTPGAYDTTHNGFYDGFISKLSGDLSTLFASTFLGSDATDVVSALTLDSAGSVYVAGAMHGAGTFPTTPNAWRRVRLGVGSEAFVSKLSGDLSTLFASTLVGGSNSDWALAVTVDGVGNVYVAGFTQGFGYPTTPGAHDTISNGSDGFVTKFNGDFSGILASTLLGGSHDAEAINAMILDAAGNVIVAGDTRSPDFPTTSDAYDISLDWTDGFITRLKGDLTRIHASTFLGGNGFDVVRCLYVDSRGNIVAAGTTRSPDFPTTPGANGYGGGADAFLTKLNGGLTNLHYSTFLGGSADEYAAAIVLDQDDNMFIAGGTRSSNFPTTPGAYDRFLDGGRDGFVAKFTPPPPVLVNPGTPDVTVTTVATPGAQVEAQHFEDIDFTDGRIGISISAKGCVWGWGTNTEQFETRIVGTQPFTVFAPQVLYLEYGARGNLGGDFSHRCEYTLQAFCREADVPHLYMSEVHHTGMRGLHEFSQFSSKAYTFQPGVQYSFEFDQKLFAKASFSGGVGCVDISRRTMKIGLSDTPRPIANAGDDQTIEARTVVLDGAGSWDPAGRPITYAWLQLTGPAVTLSDPNAEKPSFGATETATYVFQLMVHAIDTRDSFPDLVSVVVTVPPNQAPIANAGSDQTAYLGNVVSLDGSASTDPDGNYPLSYAWGIVAAPSGSIAALDDPTRVNPGFTPDQVGEYTIQLVVSDSFGLPSEADQVKVEVSPPPYLEIEIDIKPGSDPNSVNLLSKGVVPVAIFGSTDLDVNDIDVASIELAGSRVAVRAKQEKFMVSFEDVNGDGIQDLVIHVKTEYLDIAPGDTEATLNGDLSNGTQIRGKDSVRIVKYR